ncbi:holo-ACP synthase [Candidatus Poribacteria bacterium]|nr:holo-ACP synthase [Candidatus Poribacteria bacterium]
MLDAKNIVGIGYDMVEVPRIELVLSRWGNRFEKRIFTHQEIAYCQSKKNYTQRLACRFAAKEAVLKALGIGWRFGVKWTDIEIINDGFGKPSVILRGKAEELSNNLGVKKIFISMTNTKDYGAAQVILTS